MSVGVKSASSVLNALRSEGFVAIGQGGEREVGKNRVRTMVDGHSEFIYDGRKTGVCVTELLQYDASAALIPNMFLVEGHDSMKGLRTILSSLIESTQDPVLDAAIKRPLSAIGLIALAQQAVDPSYPSDEIVSLVMRRNLMSRVIHFTAPRESEIHVISAERGAQIFAHAEGVGLMESASRFAVPSMSYKFEGTVSMLGVTEAVLTGPTGWNPNFGNGLGDGVPTIECDESGFVTVGGGKISYVDTPSARGALLMATDDSIQVRRNGGGIYKMLPPEPAQFLDLELGDTVHELREPTDPPGDTLLVDQNVTGLELLTTPGASTMALWKPVRMMAM